MKASRVLAAIGLVAGAMITGAALATGPPGDVGQLGLSPTIEAAVALPSAQGSESDDGTSAGDASSGDAGLRTSPTGQGGSATEQTPEQPGTAVAQSQPFRISNAQQRLLDVSNISLGLSCASPGGAQISNGATYPDACQPASLCSLSSLIYGPFGLYDPASGDTVANSSGAIDPASLNLDPGETVQNRFVFVTAQDLEDESEAERLERLNAQVEAFGLQARLDPSCSGGLMTIELRDSSQGASNPPVWEDFTMIPGGSQFLEFSIDQSLCQNPDTASIDIRVSFTKSGESAGVRVDELEIPCFLLPEPLPSLLTRKGLLEV